MIQLLFALFLVVNLHASQKWNVEAQMKVKNLSDVQISPDAKSVFFVVTEVKGENYFSTIYRSQNRISEPFIEAASQPRLSPDGKWLAFIVSENSVRHLYMVSALGGQPIALVKGPKDVQTFAWSPDSKKITYVMTDKTNSGEDINRLYVIDVFLKTPPIALTGDDFCVRGSGDFGTCNVEFDWSPDSQKIIFAYCQKLLTESLYLDSSLALIDIEDGTISKWEKLTSFEAMPRFSPDGLQVAYLSNRGPKNYALVRQLALRNVDGSNYKSLSSTPDEGPFLAGPNLLGWSKDGKFLYFYEPGGIQFHIVLVPTDGSEAFSLPTNGLLIKEPAIFGHHLAFVGQKTDEAPEVFVTSLDHFNPTQLSLINEELSDYPQIKTEKITWSSSDGLKIEGLLTYPLDYQEDMKYPLLLVVHGGPMAFFDETYLGSPGNYPLATFAQEGYFIFRPNPRGSCGYGKEFRCMNFHDWGGMDFIDIMTGVDSLVKKGLVDEERLGIMGWSYGGYMTAWTITQTSKFKAASMGAGLCNLITMNATTDLNRFLTDYMGDSELNRDLYVDRSPVSHVSHIKTPCLIQHGATDKRVPVSQAEEFYAALQQNGKTAKLTIYPGMPHRFNSPKMYIDCMKENLEWFNSYLK